MAKNPQIQQRINEVKQCLLDQLDRKSIIEKYGNKWKVGDKAIDTYIASAKKEIARQSKELEALEHKKLEELATKNAFRKLTALEKHDLLYSIAKGELEITVKKPVFDKQTGKWVTVPVKEMPDHSTRMRAIDLDNKMAGDYAPEKKDLNLNGSFLDFLMSTD